jgi:hypothetical protein
MDSASSTFFTLIRWYQNDQDLNEYIVVAEAEWKSSGSSESGKPSQGISQVQGD